MSDKDIEKDDDQYDSHDESIDDDIDENESDSKDESLKNDDNSSSEEDEGNKEPELSDEDKAKRERRRQERHDVKQARRDREDKLRRERDSARHELDQLNHRLSLIERKSTGSELAQLDAGIKQAEDATVYFERLIEQATQNNDGASIANGVKNMIAAQRKAEELNNIKRAYHSQSQKPAALDPRLATHAQKFMSDNPWYNPNGVDVDSRLALTIDNEIARRGFNPNTEDYWAELNKEIKKYLPHRIKGGNVQSVRSESRKSVVSGSGRESSSGGSKNSYTLTPDRAQALKDTGYAEGSPEYLRVIKAYREYDKTKR